MRARRATNITRVPAVRILVLLDFNRNRGMSMVGGSSLLKNLHCLTHFCNSEDHEHCIGAGLGSAVAVVDGEWFHVDGGSA